MSSSKYTFIRSYGNAYAYAFPKHIYQIHNNTYASYEFIVGICSITANDTQMIISFTCKNLPITLGPWDSRCISSFVTAINAIKMNKTISIEELTEILCK